VLVLVKAQRTFVECCAFALLIIRLLELRLWRKSTMALSCIRQHLDMGTDGNLMATHSANGSVQLPCDKHGVLPCVERGWGETWQISFQFYCQLCRIQR
jgi:hypothetical protein